jgi:hypothetical protein
LFIWEMIARNRRWFVAQRKSQIRGVSPRVIQILRVPWVLSVAPWLKAGFIRLFFVIFVFGAVAGAAPSEIKRTAAPDWVQSVDVDLSATKVRGDVGAGESRLLIERQVNAADATNYTHVATRFLTGKGVEEGSRISITFAATFGWRWAVTRRRDTATADSVALHRCVVCGETEESNPALEFRVATDGLDYCQRHRPSRAPDAK